MCISVNGQQRNLTSFNYQNYIFCFNSNNAEAMTGFFFDAFGAWTRLMKVIFAIVFVYTKCSLSRDEAHFSSAKPMS